MMNNIEYDEEDSFKKSFKKLAKRFRTLPDDLKIAKKNTIELYHLKGINNKSIILFKEIPSKELVICKIRKFACKSLKGKGAMSGIRVIYAFHKPTYKVKLIEIYFKQDQENESKKLVKEFIDNF